MKKINIVFVLVVMAVMLIFAGCGESKDSKEEVNATVKVEASRNADVEIPVGVTVPELEEGEQCPVVLVFHGFLGSRDEGGIFSGKEAENGYDGLAEQLLELGIGTIRIDQSGCGESSEDLENYTIGNSISDMEDAYAYCMENYPFDENKVGIVGHSMGGKLAPKYASEHPEVTAMVLLNPAGDNGNTSLLTAAAAGLDYPVLAEAEVKNGKIYNEALSQYVGADMYMSEEYFKEVDASETGDEIKEFVKAGNHGLMIYGGKDNIINPKTYSWITANTGISYACIEDMGHELGREDNNTEMINMVVEMSASHLYRFLSR